MPVSKTQTPPPELTPDEALAKLENFCVYRERCPKEVRQKMRELGVGGKVGEQIFGLLRDEGFFNEERFAAAFASGKFRVNNWGKARIRQELKLRDIGQNFIDTALGEIPESEYLAVFEKLKRQKLAQLKKESPFAARQKLIAYLIRAGFEQEMVFQNI